jgi:hypothetical protein
MSSLKKIKTDFNKINQSLIQKIEEITVDSSKDPIFSQFIRLYNSTSVMRIEKSETLIQRAFFGSVEFLPDNDNHDCLYCLR